MATTRTTRTERKARTRADLLAAARRVFLRRGFHAASLDEIAEEAGYTKGAVYSNFRGKDDLFLALLAEHYALRTRAYAELVLDEDDPEEVRRSIARYMLDTYEQAPAWWTLTSDFSTHASTNPESRERLRELREGFFDALAEVIDQLGRRHGVTYTLPAKEIARGTSALMRGMVTDWILEPGGDRREVFEELVAAYLRGAAVPLDEGSAT
jgi:AcrR family transcriptional regulator